MRLASFNVLHGRSLTDGHVSTPRLVAACASLGADVLALQEIDRNQARSGGVDQTAAVAEGTGAVDWRFEPALIGEPGATWRAATDSDDPAGADAGYGVGLVSRLPVGAWHVVRLAAAKVRAPVAVPGGRGRFILLPDEPRVALAAVGLPCVLLGDLNVPGALPARASGWRPLARVKTFPGASPSMQLDHALGHGPLPPVGAAAAPELPLSDHRALVVDFL